VLVLNATSLNTGHNWYFTASSMGEVPPRNVELRDIDKKDRYRRVRYAEITSRTPDFNLASAVAASAAVPGLFPPMAVSDLYEDRRVQLVDGGVFDNQGISGVLDPDHRCSDFVVSDASGQNQAKDNPDTSIVSTLSTTTSILLGRVREEMVNNLENGDRPQEQSNNFAYLHLTRGLFAQELSAIGQPAETQAGRTQMHQSIVSSKAEFDVDGDMQRTISEIRTDLDSFSNVEARCLEADAYQMSQSRLERLPERYRAQESTSYRWQFMPYISRLADGDPQTLKHIHVASAKFFKPLLHVLNGTAGFGKSIGLLVVSLPLIAVLVGLAYLINWVLLQVMPYSLWQIATDVKVFQKFMFDAAPVLYALLIAFVVSWLADRFIEGSGKWVVWIRKIAKSPMSFIVGTVTRLVLPAIVAIPIVVYVYTIDRYFVKVLGRLD
jgi:NTE family protein